MASIVFILSTGCVVVAHSRLEREEMSYFIKTSWRRIQCCLLLASFALTACSQPNVNSPTGQQPELKSGDKTEPIIYLALGDSTGIGLGAGNGGGYVDRLLQQIQQLRPGSRLINLSEAGATTNEVNRRISNYSGASPSLVTIGIGVNDVVRGMDETEFASNYEKILERLKKFGAPTVIINVPDFSLAPAIPESMRKQLHDRIQLFNKSIAEIAGRYQLPLVDVYQTSQEIIPAHPEFFSADGFHPSDAGYKFLADKIWPTVQKSING
jgi:acyl-CoA thioesterase-1